MRDPQRHIVQFMLSLKMKVFLPRKEHHSNTQMRKVQINYINTTFLELIKALRLQHCQRA